MENKDSLYRGNDCMKKVCAYLKEYATNVIKFEKKKMLPLTKKKLKLHQNATEYYICGKRFIRSLLIIKIIKIIKTLATIAILQANAEAQHIVYVI